MKTKLVLSVLMAAGVAVSVGGCSDFSGAAPAVGLAGGNSAGGVPLATAVSITDVNGGSAIVGDALSSKYTYSDVDGDNEGTSIFSWLRDGVAIAGADTKNYTLVAADSGASIAFEVTPIAATGRSTGKTVKSDSITVVNSAPTASSVSIVDTNGGKKLVGDAMEGNYVYADIDDDAEGTSTFRWLRNDVAISGATASSYTTVSADNSKQITFEVTPVAVAGTKTGSAVTATVFVGDIPPQIANISIADPLGTPVVTITNQPTHMVLAGTVSTNGTTVSLDLDVTNNTDRLLFSPKVVVDSISDSNASNAPVATSTGTIDTKGFAGFGMAAVPNGDTVSALDAIVISDADGIVDDPLLLTVSIPTDHRMVVHMQGYNTVHLLDLSGTQPSQTIGLSCTGLHYDSCADGGIRDGVSSLDGRFMYFGYRNKPSIMKFDTVTQTITEHEMIAGGAAGDAGSVFAATMKVAQSSDGVYLYALVVDGDHAYDSADNNTVSYLYKVNASTMAVVGSPITLHTSAGGDAERPSDISITADNSKAAISHHSDVEGFIYLVNLNSMTVTNTFDVSADTTHPISVAINSSADTIYFGDRNNGVYSLTVAGGAVSAITTSVSSYVHDLKIGPDGRLYYASGSDGLYALDLVGSTEVTLNTNSITKIVFASDGYLYAAEDTSPANFTFMISAMIHS